jgi:succinyl-CoA synthetase alpha subunit
MIYGDKKTGILVQGATGKQGEFHIGLMNSYAREVGGRGVVAGVTPGKGGQQVHGVPVYNTVREAMSEHDIGASVIFVPAGAAADAIMEEANAGIETIVCITEHIPVHDTMKAVAYATMQGSAVIGPNCPGLLSPGEVKMGIMPARLFSRGNVGVISRSGTLTYEVVDELTRAGIGQSSVVGIGGDPVIGQTFVDVLKRRERNAPTSRSLPTLPASRPRPTSGWGTRVRSWRAAKAMPAPRSPGSRRMVCRLHPALRRFRIWSGNSSAGADFFIRCCPKGNEHEEYPENIR